MTRYRLQLYILMIVTSILVAPVHTTAQPPADDYWVYFTSQGADGDLTTTHLYRMRLSDHTIEALTDNSQFENVYMEFWSPDREWIYFSDGVGTLYRVHYDGADVRPISEWGSYPVSKWSPDGNWLLIATVTSDGTYLIYHMRPDGSEVLNLRELYGGTLGFKDWTPDSRRLVVSFSPTAKPDYTTALDGSDLQPLVEGYQAIYGRWSPDGEWLYFTVERNDGTSDVMRMNTTTQTVELVSEEPRPYQIGLWSLDGQWLRVIEPGGVWLIDNEGHIHIITSISPIANIRFSPDSQWVYYMDFGGGSHAASTSTPVQMMPVPDYIHAAFTATPDNQRLISRSQDSPTTLLLSSSDGANVSSIEYSFLPDQIDTDFYYGPPVEWTPDGAWLLFTGITTGKRDVYRLNLMGDIERLTDFEGTDVYVGVHE